MKKKLRKVLLLLTCAALIACSALVGCTGGGKKPAQNGKNEYSIYVTSMGGLGLQDVSVAATSSGAPIASGKTNKNGVFTFSADKGEYDIAVSNLPLGYTLVESNTYKTSKEKTSLLILASSAVLKEKVPSNKVYRQGDVIYDFSITDKSDASETKTYTLSDVLETKKMVLLNFWNTNCSPCMSEMPELELAYRDYSETVEIFGINVPLLGINTLADIRKTRTAQYKDAENNPYSLTFPLNLDENEMPLHFGLTAIPVSVVIDRYGVVALIHTGSMDKSGFAALFKKYTSDNYVQDTLPDEGDEPPEEEIPERVKPNVSQPDSKQIEAAINGTGFNGAYYPETQTADAEYSWPWLVGETGGEQYIHPANEGVNYSFATIYTKVTLSADDIADPEGKVVLVFDLQWSCENLGDYFYVIANNTLVYEYTGTEQWGEWQPCYALVADEPGEYTIGFMYVKDQQLSEGADTVRIKNMRLISVPEISIPSLDMPREGARGWDGKNFSSYITVVKDDEGFYHKDTKDGPYVVADLMSTTSFNNRLETSWGINLFSVNGYFDYNDVEYGEPGYDESLDDTYAITIWEQAANNSELYGLTVVNDELIGLLNTFIKTQVGSSYHDKMWLEVCKYFDHYGTDEKDKGISTPDRNPIRGLLNYTAVPTVEVHEGAFTAAELKNVPEEYRNKVVLPRLIVPRGFKYLFVPKESGVYRFRSQSKELSDTMAWLMDYDAVGEDFLVTTDQQLENPDENYNFVLTYYLEKDKKYILATCFADIGGTGEYTFTIEHLGPSAYVWQFAARNYFTTTDDEMTEIINYKNVEPVLHTDGYYYNAKKDADGKYILENGKYVANTDDPIYVDFLTGARFFDDGSLERCFTVSEKSAIVMTLSSIFSTVFGIPRPADGWPESTAPSDIKGSFISRDDWKEIVQGLYEKYGDNVIVDDDTITAFSRCTTLGEMANIIKYNYLNFFDFENRRFDGVDIDESRYIDYTDLVKAAYNEAKKFAGTKDRGYADKGCVKLNDELRGALDMFCKNMGGFPELDTDWLRLCAHFEYIGPYRA